MATKRKTKTETAEELQETMTANQVNGDNVEKVDFANRAQAEEALTGTERFQAMSKEEQEEALKKVRQLASKPKKNPDLPGMTGEGVARVEHDDIETAAAEYASHMEARTASLRLEIEAKKQLIALMKSHNLKEYETNDGTQILVKHKDATETVKLVKASKEEMEIEED